MNLKFLVQITGPGDSGLVITPEQLAQLIRFKTQASVDNWHMGTPPTVTVIQEEVAETPVTDYGPLNAALQKWSNALIAGEQLSPSGELVRPWRTDCGCMDCVHKVPPKDTPQTP